MRLLRAALALLATAEAAGAPVVLPSLSTTCSREGRQQISIGLKQLTVQASPQLLYCDHEDIGTCGSRACCTVQAISPPGCDSVCAVQHVRSFLGSGGRDRSFTLSNSTDLRDLAGHERHNLAFLLSGTHRSDGGDLQGLWFSIAPVDVADTQAVVKGFSMSTRGPMFMYRDQGQNYKNLAEVFKGMARDWGEVVALHGCGHNGLMHEQSSASVAFAAGVLGLIAGGMIAGVSMLSCTTRAAGQKRNDEWF